MKKIITLIALAITLVISAQAPQGFNYQATVRNSAGALIINQNVNFKFNIMLNSSTSAPVYTETKTVTTDDLGQVSLVVGTGTATKGTFSSINWANGSYYLGIELNTGTGFVAMGITQLLSVPYAMYANSSGTSNTSNMMVSPTVTTAAVSNLTMYNATLSATITNANLNQINEKGFAYSVNPNPRIYNKFSGSNPFPVYSVEVSDPFEYTINNLDMEFLPNTTYYIRAYVVTENDVVVYGNQVSFITLSIYQNGNGVTDVEGNQYPSILLNGKEWMQNNLNVSKYRNGDSIPEVTDETQWASLTTGAWRYIANDPAYGKLYNWYAVNDPRGLAPQGWHVSTNSELNSLVTFLGGADAAGGKMKGGDWIAQGSYTIGSGYPPPTPIQFSNISGFKALGGSQVGADGQVQCNFTVIETFYVQPTFNPIYVPGYWSGRTSCSNNTGSAGNWWSATSVNSTTANYIGLTIDSASVTAAASDKKFGYSVRCVKN